MGTRLMRPGSAARAEDGDSWRIRALFQGQCTLAYGANHAGVTVENAPMEECESSCLAQLVPARSVVGRLS